MRWYEYKMEVDDLHASDDLKAKLLALQANAAETPGAKSIAMPAPSPTPQKQKKPLRFPARRFAQLAACVAVCGVCLYGAVYAYEWKGVTLLGGGSSSNYSAAATKAAAPQAAVYSMEDTENAASGSADNGISTFSAEDGYRSADTAAGGSLLTSGEAESDASTRTADSAKIIYTANLTLETRDYDTARAALDAALSDADGYMESSSEYTNTDSTRSVSLTLRVPQDSYKSFLAAAAQSGSVTYQNQQAEDITTRYMDTEARLASLTAQRTRLQELQAQADTLADLLEIESSLSDVQYQIESWQSQLDWYSNQVSCCTVYITLNEVETLTPTSTSFGAKLLAALRNDCRLVLVGDPDQLPSVGPGSVLGDMLRSGVVPAVSLTQVFRQAEQSAIIRAAHAVDRGELPPLENSGSGDLFFLRRRAPDRLVQTVVELCRDRLPKNMGIPAEQIQVLSPTRKGPCGTAALNRALQAALNPPERGKRQKQWGDMTFRVGDRVMQTRNNYDVLWEKEDGSGGSGIFNGDVGVIQDIDPGGELITLRFDDRTAVYTADLLSQLDMAYAVTVHKSQGSEYPAVILAAASAAPSLLVRGVLYTAITRARRLLILAGDDAVLAQMAANNKQQRRYSGLRRRLKEGYHEQ